MTTAVPVGMALSLGMGFLGEGLLAAADSDPIGGTDAVYSATFPLYRTRADVLYWMKHYYRHPQADLLKIAFESLRKERMTPEDGWLVAGLVAGIIKHSPDSVSNRIICEAYDTLGDFRQGLLVGLWLGGDHGKDYLQVLKEEEQDAQMKETINHLLRTPPPDLLSAQVDATNSNMIFHLLLGVFCATEDTSVVDKLIDVSRDWSTEVLKEGPEGIGKFFVAKAAREKLALLCQEHAAARDTCKQALEQRSLTAEQREVIQGILESIARFEDEQKKQPQPTL
jgi:hypothetical protein